VKKKKQQAGEQIVKQIDAKQIEFWPTSLEALFPQKKLDTLIELPNGWLDEYDQLPLPLTMTPGVVAFLRGELICVMCKNEFKARVMIANRFAMPAEKESTVVCPDCNAPILHLGTDNARAMLTRFRRRKKK